MSGDDAELQALVDDEAVVLFGDILRLTNTIRGRSDGAIRGGSGLAGSEFEVLLRLARHPDGRTTSARLAEELSFTSGGLTRLISRMESESLLIRRPHPDDRRAALLEATSRGTQRLRQALQAHVPQINDDLLALLTPTERLILQELVTKVLRHPFR
jgi:DNA-binding MarR family transcriptional regulator